MIETIRKTIIDKFTNTIKEKEDIKVFEVDLSLQLVYYTFGQNQEKTFEFLTDIMTELNTLSEKIHFDNYMVTPIITEEEDFLIIVYLCQENFAHLVIHSVEEDDKEKSGSNIVNSIYENLDKKFNK